MCRADDDHVASVGRLQREPADDDMGPVVSSRVPGGAGGEGAGEVEYNFTAIAQLYDYIVD